MVRLCEIICMFFVLVSVADVFWDFVKYICKLVRKHFPNVRKRKERT